ncbi:uncharacterized protein LOC128333696 isoform X1 [Hemicordylus capensis]|uniref:uncharacterized protein LOC128333696 isoform X1 n=1 Tax=Hemicordylus capensis TaxID=884348 RepID=UPI002302A581|nr:uncharacterized protein LOC128333696 isoform X1 [Hemicordylus capensis]
MSRPRKPQSPAFQPWATSQPFGQASGGTLQSENARGNVTDPNMVALFARFFGKGSGGEISINSSEHSGLLPPPVDYSLRDTDQKGLYLHEENLVVAPLQGTNSAHEASTLTCPCPLLLPFRPSPDSVEQGVPTEGPVSSLHMWDGLSVSGTRVKADDQRAPQPGPGAEADPPDPGRPRRLPGPLLWEGCRAQAAAGGQQPQLPLRQRGGGQALHFLQELQRHHPHL